MKKCLLSLILAVSLCMGLTVPAFAAQAGDTTLTDIHGWQYTLSQPIIGTEFFRLRTEFLPVGKRSG